MSVCLWANSKSNEHIFLEFIWVVIKFWERSGSYCGYKEIVNFQTCMLFDFVYEIFIDYFEKYCSITFCHNCWILMKELRDSDKIYVVDQVSS